MNQMKRIISLLAFIIFISLLPKFLVAQKDVNFVEPVWQVINIGSYIGNGNFLCKDFDNDGKEELVFSGNQFSSDPYLAVFEYKHNNYIPVWTKAYDFDSYVSVLQTADIDGDGVYEIYTLLASGIIEVYNSESMELIGVYTTTAETAHDAKLADVNNDGVLEYVVVSLGGDTYLKVYDAATLELIYEISNIDAFQVEVGDVDGDGANEIILSSGYIIDGSTFEVEWQYVNGFGLFIELGDTNGDAIPEIISTGYNSILAFDGNLHTPLWQINTGYSEIDDLLVTDIEGDGNAEILVGLDDWDAAIACYDAQTQIKLWENTDENMGVSKIGVGDPDNDGVKEFFWGSGIASTTPDYLHVASFDNYQTEWTSLSLDGRFFVSASDINANDSLELIVASSSSDNGYGNGLILPFNGFTKEMMQLLEVEIFNDISCMKTGNINSTNQSEIVIGIDGKVVVYDGLTFQKLWTSQQMGTISDIELVDVDSDNFIELVVGNSNGHITVFDGTSFQLEWQSIDTGGWIGDIEIENCDGDEALEIVFNNHDGIIQMYDGITHFLEWQSAGIDEVTAIDVKDYNQDGIMDIIAGDYNGSVRIISCDNFAVSATINAFDEIVSNVEVANLDSTAAYELFIGSTTLKIFSTTDLELIWESEYLGSNVGRNDALIFTDSDNNQYMEVFYGTRWGAFMLEASTRYPDITPPRVISVVPPANMNNVGTNINIIGQLSELMDTGTINTNNVSIKAEGGMILAASVSYDEATNQISIAPQELLPVDQLITVTISGNVSDTTGNGLDGNCNGISEGSPDDDYVWTFSTGHGADLTGPVFTSIAADSEEKWAGISIVIDGVLTDYSDFAQAPLKDAEYFVDNIGASGEGIKMNPVDGLFNSLEEAVYAIIPTDGWTAGEHTLYFHGQDFIGNWGDYAIISIIIQAEIPGNWTMYGNNPQHTGYNHFDTLNLPLNLEWTKDFEAQNLSHAYVVNDRVVISSKGFNVNKGLYVLDAITGEVVWVQNMFGSDFVNPPAFAYGLIYMQVIGINDDYIKAFDISTGNMVWESPYGSQWGEYLAPTIANGRVFVSGGTYGGVYAFDARNGEEYWFHSLPQNDDWTPAFFKDTVYTFTANSYYDQGYLAAISATTGMLLWDKDDIHYSMYDNSLNTSPVIDTVNRVIIATSPSYQTAIDMDSRETLWFKNGIFKSPAVHNSIVYSANNNNLKAYDIRTGAYLWGYEASEVLFGQPVISGNYVFISTAENVSAIDLTTHNEIWSYNAGGLLSLGNGQLFVSDPESGILYAFRELITGTTEEEPKANGIQLLQNYPNPMLKNGQTTISYYLPEAAMVHLALYNMQGKAVALIDEGNKASGNHAFTARFSYLPAGIYYYKLVVNEEFQGIKKLILYE